MPSLSSNPASTLEQEIGETHQLLQLMRQEQELLTKADIKELDELVKNKGIIIARLSELAKQRHQHLVAAGFEQKEASMQAWVNSLSPSESNYASIQKQWSELIALTKSAKEANRVNGLLIGSHLKRNQLASNALRNATKGESLYGPDGQRDKDSTGRYLAIS